MKYRMTPLVILVAFLVSLTAPVSGGEAVTSEEGKHFDAEENPTYKIESDGTVDWFTYSGFRRYHSECHVCHGPDGLGSSFAPGLVESLRTLSYDDFNDIVVNGRENVGVSVQNKMPAFGENLNVMCFLDDIYIYLKARSDEALGRGRPSKKTRKTEATRNDELECMEG